MPDADYEDVAAAVEFEAKPENRIEVGAAAKPHPIVARLGRAYRSAEPDKFGMLAPARGPRLVVRSSAAGLDRALGILDAICRACDRRGWGLSMPTPADTPFLAERARTEPLTARVLGEEVRFVLEEAARRQFRRLPPPPEPRPGRSLLDALREGRPYDGPSHSDSIYEYHPTGMLTLQIQVPAVPLGRAKWTDTPAGKVERELNGFMAALARAAGALRAERLREEREKQDREADWRRHEEREHAERFRRLLATELEEEAERWASAHRLRAYVQAVRDAHAGESPIAPDSALGRWLAWAEDHAARADPCRTAKRDPADPPPIVRGPVPTLWRWSV